MSRVNSDSPNPPRPPPYPSPRPPPPTGLAPEPALVRPSALHWSLPLWRRASRAPRTRTNISRRSPSVCKLRTWRLASLVVASAAVRTRSSLSFWSPYTSSGSEKVLKLTLPVPSLSVSVSESGALFPPLALSAGDPAAGECRASRRCLFPNTSTRIVALGEAGPWALEDPPAPSQPRLPMRRIWAILNSNSARSAASWASKSSGSGSSWASASASRATAS
mmetsp:Transcript_301/g.660  ORF Transcript_301/g.660 Transcript_301/m.660 type:complete len:221 (+) Transcript_301:294-956(+)